MQNINHNYVNSVSNYIFLIKILETAQNTISIELLNHVNDDDIGIINRLLKASESIDEALTALCSKD